jgi:hypothetical protein
MWTDRQTDRNYLHIMRSFLAVYARNASKYTFPAGFKVMQSELRGQCISIFSFLKERLLCNMAYRSSIAVFRGV